jgi:hypothetical protein
VTKFQVEFREVYVIESDSKGALVDTLADGPDLAMLREALVDCWWTEPETVIEPIPSTPSTSSASADADPKKANG